MKSALQKLGKRISKDTVVNKVNGKEVYFCCINDLKDQISDDELNEIKKEFTKNFNIVGVVRDYSKRADKRYTQTGAEITSNPSPTLYTCLGAYKNIIAA